MNIAIGILIYPGLALALAIGLTLRRLTGEALLVRRLALASAFGTIDAITALASIALVALGLMWAPLPYSPLGEHLSLGRAALVWVALEAAMLAPALAGLLASSPLAQRVTSRDMQIGLGGRTVLWLTIGALASQAEADLRSLIGRALLLVAGLLVLPAAAGLGPFAPERSLTAAGAEVGLDDPAKALLRLARTVRGAALLILLIAVALAPVALRPVLALLIALAVLLVYGLALRAATGLPNFTLPAALRWCWTRALPLALTGLLVLVLLEGK